MVLSGGKKTSQNKFHYNICVQELAGKVGSHSIEEMVASGAGKPRTNVQNATNQVGGAGGGADRGESSVEQLKKIASTLTRNA